MRLGGLLRRRAGRGKHPRAEQTPTADAGGPKEITEIPTTAIVPSPFQPRLHIEDDALAELAASMDENGLLQPIVVRAVDDGYELVTGERRWRASRSLGWEKIPAIVRELTDEAAAALAMIENLQREDLTAIEEAKGYRSLLDRFEWTQTELARRIGKSQSTVANKLRLLRLPVSIQEQVSRQALTERHARALLRLEEAGPEAQEQMAAEAEGNGWTVDETERRVKQLLAAGETDADAAGGEATSQGQRVVRVFKDLRLFRNGIFQVVKEMERTGLAVDVDEAVNKDDDAESWEIRLLVRRTKG